MNSSRSSLAVSPLALGAIRLAAQKKQGRAVDPNSYRGFSVADLPYLLGAQRLVWPARHLCRPPQPFRYLRVGALLPPSAICRVKRRRWGCVRVYQRTTVRHVPAMVPTCSGEPFPCKSSCRLRAELQRTCLFLASAGEDMDAESEPAQHGNGASHDGDNDEQAVQRRSTERRGARSDRHPWGIWYTIKHDAGGLKTARICRRPQQEPRADRWNSR